MFKHRIIRDVFIFLELASLEGVSRTLAKASEEQEGIVPRTRVQEGNTQ